jgi:uncharacterized lipoprotein YmbA
MMGLKLALTLAALLVLAAGCAGGGAPVVYYTLQSSPLSPAMAGLTPAEIGVGPVILPDYLERSALVTRISPNQLNIHQGHHWAGSLRDEIVRVVSANLKSACPGATVRPHPWAAGDPPAVRFRISILSFEGRPGEEVNLKVAWYVENKRAGRSPLRRETHIRHSVKGEDLEAYTAAMGQALAGLAREMAKDVEAMTDASYDR